MNHNGLKQRWDGFGALGLEWFGFGLVRNCLVRLRVSARAQMDSSFLLETTCNTAERRNTSTVSSSRAAKGHFDKSQPVIFIISHGLASANILWNVLMNSWRLADANDCKNFLKCWSAKKTFHNCSCCFLRCFAQDNLCTGCFPFSDLPGRSQVSTCGAQF